MIRRLFGTLFGTVLFLLVLTPSYSIAQDQATGDSVAVQTPVYDSLFLKEKTPQPPFNISAEDVDNDAGGAIRLKWDLSPDDFKGGNVKEYLVLRSETPDGEFDTLGNTTQGLNTLIDNQAESGTQYYYKVVALNYEKVDYRYLWHAGGESAVIGPVVSSAQWFNMARIWVFVSILFVCGSIVYFITGAKSGKTFYIRKIAGIDEVENAVGRATEMGRTIYYVPGINDMDDVQTLASMSILGRVSVIAAENDTRIDVPVSRSLVMVTAREIVKESYSKVGRPDSFQEEQVRYLTDDQFGYAAAIDGLFVREKPATVFLIGAFFAESLIMAETGNSIGAIQIAGTAMPAQLPFFVAACDYTLIGEELFAASAYLSREPKLLGSLKGQDMGKAMFLLAILVGILLQFFGVEMWRLFEVR